MIETNVFEVRMWPLGIIPSSHLSYPRYVLTVQFLRDDKHAASLAVWVCMVPSQAMGDAVLLEQDTAGCV